MIRTITQVRDRAETEFLARERELTAKQSRLDELKEQRNQRALKEILADVLETFDSQDNLKKRGIIQMMIERVVVRKDNKLEMAEEPREKSTGSDLNGGSDGTHFFHS